MRKFLLKLSIFIFLIAIAYAVLYLKLPRKYYSGDNYILTSAILAKITTGTNHKNVLIGDSRPQMGLDANSIHAVNFSVSATGPVEGFYEVRALLENKFHKVDTLFISYSLRHLISQDYFYKGTYYYSYIDRTYLDSAITMGRQFDDVSYDPMYSIYSGQLDRIFGNLQLSAKILDLEDFMSGGLNGTFEYYKKSTSGHLLNGDNQIQNGRLLVFPSDTMKFIRTTGNPILDEELLKTKFSKVDEVYLNKIINISKEHHVTAYFILMPSEQSLITPILKKEIIHLRTLFGEKLLYDNSIYDDHYFRDNAGHLNSDGSRRFAKFLENKLYGITDNN